MSKIYVVDDDQDMVYMVKLALEKHSYKVETFRNGNEALKAVKASIPDLMIVDLTMPEMNGWSLCMKIREDDRCKNLPIIVLSGLAAEEECIPESNEPYNLLMAKPFEILNLLSKIKSFLPSS